MPFVQAENVLSDDESTDDNLKGKLTNKKKLVSDCFRLSFVQLLASEFLIPDVVSSFACPLTRGVKGPWSHGMLLNLQLLMTDAGGKLVKQEK